MEMTPKKCVIAGFGRAGDPVTDRAKYLSLAQIGNQQAEEQRAIDNGFGCAHESAGTGDAVYQTKML